MAVPGVLGDYIVKNYKRLLICVAPPAESADDADEDDAVRSQSPDDRPRRRRSSIARVRSSRSIRRARAATASASASATPPPDAEAEGSDEDEPFVCVHEGLRMVRGRRFHLFRANDCVRVGCRHSWEAFADGCLCPYLCCYSPRSAEDPFRGCVQSRQSEGPRRSGDFVILGCMQV